MNDKIEVGEYVRTNLGSIGKVTKIEDGKFLYENKCLICFISNVVKHSKNIIDLIEVGDIVILEDEFDKNIYYMYDESFVEATKQDIKEGETLRSILSREEFEERKYNI